MSKAKHLNVSFLTLLRQDISILKICTNSHGHTPINIANVVVIAVFGSNVAYVTGRSFTTLFADIACEL